MKKLIPVILACLSLSSINANAVEITTSVERETACDSISKLGSMVMQIRQYKPDISKEMLVETLNLADDKDLISKKEKKEQNVVKIMIESAYSEEVVEGDDNKKNAIIAFQVETYDYCLKAL